MEVIILEDEQIAAKRLKRMLEDLDMGIQVVEIFESIQDTAQYLLSTERDPEVLFVDIQVVDGNSMELFEIIEVKPKVIFTTAHDEYAVLAFRKNALDYLLKPIKKDELREAVSKARTISADQALNIDKKQSLYKSRFLIRFGTQLKNVKTEDIAYVYSENKLCYFVARDGTRTPSDYKLKDLENLLDPKLFFRINRQFIIQIDAISKIRTHFKSRLRLELSPAFDEDVIISTHKTPDFKQWLDR